MKSWSRQRYGRLNLNGNEMDEYVFYTNAGEGLGVVMKGLALCNGAVHRNALI